MKTIDAVVPIYNEENILPELNDRLVKTLESLPYAWRIVYVNDGSRDRSAELIAKYCLADSRIGSVELSRNFGQQLAIATGLSVTAGDAVVLLDGDIARSAGGHSRPRRKVVRGLRRVFAIKRKRKET